MPKPEENKPLAGLNIVITRAADQTGREVDVLKNFGANVILFPTIKTVICNDLSAMVNPLQKGDIFDYIIFTSTNAVSFFYDLLKNNSLEFPSNSRIVAVGEKTAGLLEESGHPADLVPDQFTAEGVVKLMGTLNIKGEKILLPQSSIAHGLLREELSKLGAEVTAVNLYETVIPDKIEYKSAAMELRDIKSGLFIFTSPSTFNNFLKIEGITNAPEYFEPFKVAVIGSITATAVKNSGVSVDIIPEKFTMENLIKEILKYYTN